MTASFALACGPEANSYKLIDKVMRSVNRKSVIATEGSV